LRDDAFLRAYIPSVATHEKARLAKQRLVKQLEGEDWLRGVGLGGKGDQFTVQVNVDHLTPSIAKRIPKKILGVEVEIAEVGKITPHLVGDKA
jgi:hypothetical protein